MEPRRYGPFPYTPINRRPKLQWPNRARVAVWVCPNLEVFALNEPIPTGSGKVPDVPAWSLRDYGARVGIFRIMEVLSKRGIRATASIKIPRSATPIPRSSKTRWRWAGNSSAMASPTRAG